MDKINFYILCRICLKDSHSYSNIFEEHLMNGCFVNEILNDVYDLNIFSGDGLPEFVCVQCLSTIKSFILFVRKVHKGRLALAHLKQEMDKSNSAPVLLKSDVLAFQRDVDRQDEVITTQTSGHSSANVGPTSSNAEVITADIIPSNFTIKEEPMKEEETESGTCEYSAATVLPTSSNAEVITSDLITSEITIKEESLETTINPEEVISYSSSDEVCDDPFGETEAGVSSAPNLLMYDDLQLNKDNQPQEVGGKETAPGKVDKGTKGWFECHRCKKVLTTKRGFRRHLDAHEIGRSYQCIHCSKHFSRNEHLRRHLVVHSGEKPYSCTHCNQQFGRKEHLSRHLAVHSGERPFLCMHCNQQFGQKDHLRRHLMLHMGYKLHVCVRCNKQFSRREHLQRHVRNMCAGNS